MLKSTIIGTFLLSTLILISKMAYGGTTAPPLSASRNLFAEDLLNPVVSYKQEENVIYSPASIQSCFTLAFFGADGSTAEEMRKGLKLGTFDTKDIAEEYGNFLKTTFKSDANGPQLRMANRIYVNQNLEINTNFNDIAKNYFNSEAEQVNFADAAQTVKKINNWVEQQTENKIQNLLSADSVNEETSSVLVNAIYFKANWTTPFSKSSTHKADFFVKEYQKESVDMMFLSERVKYAELSDLDATVLELSYKDSDVSMMIILPNKINGLQVLEKKLATVDPNEVASKLKPQDVDVFLPKFKIEYELNLKDILSKMGMSTMFSDEANFSKLFNTDVAQKISEARHKAYLDVNEAGSEAAAATFIKIVPMSLNLEQKTFRADHPFFFAIRNSKAIFFTGHVAKF